MGNLYGGTLNLRDGFTRTLQQFSRSVQQANNNLNTFRDRIEQSEASNRLATRRMQQQIQQLAQQYVQQGYTMQQAMRRATQSVQRSAPTTGNAWIDVLGRIRQVGTDAFNNIRQSSNNFSNSILGTLSKLTAGFLSLKGMTSLFKESLDSAVEFQNAKMYLDAMYNGNGVEKYKWATNYANETPFEEGEVVNSLSTAKALDMDDSESAMKLYGDLGSLAKLRKVGGINEAVLAINDAQNGEWMRLQTILGVKRQGLEDYAKEKGLDSFSNKKGQVTSKENLMKVFQSYLDDKGITGITEKYGKTFEGRVSTLKGNWKKALAGLMGIAEDGTVKDGSLFANLAKSLETLIASVNRFAESGGAEKIGDFLGKVGGKISDFLNYLSENPEAVDILLKAGTALIGLKVAGSVLSPLRNLIGIIGGSGAGGLLGSSGLCSGALSLLSSSLGKATIGIGVFAAASKSLFNENGILHKIGNGLNPVNWFASKGNKVDGIAAAEALIKQGGAGWNWLYEKMMGNDDADKNYKANVTKAWADSDRADAKLNGVSDNIYEWGDSTKSKYKNLYDYEKFYNHDASYAKFQQPSISVNVERIDKDVNTDELMKNVMKQYQQYATTRNGD
ncbi:hypothetical protein [uncultured Clostridium sp.]|uniref:hypothetical protein n=1 Tax=uncultured Clostridium sp. TaxID=59620 RepID=UPI0025D735A7|nr:hypothetical protein [uncultured Clostridium sp.]